MTYQENFALLNLSDLRSFTPKLLLYPDIMESDNFNATKVCLVHDHLQKTVHDKINNVFSGEISMSEFLTASVLLGYCRGIAGVLHRG